MLASITLLHAACALLYAVLAALVVARARRSSTGWLLGLACLGTAIWAATVAFAPNPAWSSLLDLLRPVLWYGFVRHLYSKSILPAGNAQTSLTASRLADTGVRDERIAGQHVLTASVLGLAGVGLVALLLPELHGWQPGWAWDPVESRGGLAVIAGVPVAAMLVAVRLGLSVCTVLLIENLYRNTSPEARWHVNLPCIALGGMFVYDILLAADTALFHRVSAPLFEGRAVAFALVAPLLAVAAARNRTWEIDIHVSRAAVFHSATLIASGVLLMSLAAAGELVRRFGVTRLGADWGGVAEVGLIFAGVIAVAVLVTSGRARSRLRALVVDHFFSHRYDYRREWSRCIETLSAPAARSPDTRLPDTRLPDARSAGSGPESDAAGEGGDIGLHRRVIRAVAEVVDAPGGVLFLRDAEEAAFRWAGSWNLPAVAAAVMPDHPLIAQFRDGSWIVPLEAFAPEGSGAGHQAEAGEALTGLQLAVPLFHGRLTGFILAAAPRAAFKLDGEVFDLLRIVAAEVARTIAEQRLTQSLVQTRQLHEYGKRFAFVAHDIKNVSNQLALLLANAEVHLENPEFQRDMLATVRASVQKINIMIKRLQDPGAAEAHLQPGARTLRHSLVVPAERLAALVAALPRPVALETDGRAGDVAMPPAAFDAVVTHLVNNAVEASAPDAPVRVRLRHEARRVTVEVVDRGCGMSPEFIRDALFQPFRSSKGEGTGIGAYQARELLREAGGDLIVISQPGEGTTMRMMLPAIGVVAASLAPAVADGSPNPLAAA